MISETDASLIRDTVRKSSVEEFTRESTAHDLHMSTNRRDERRALDQFTRLRREDAHG